MDNPSEWFEKYMLADREDREKRAARIVRYFVDHHEHQSHALAIERRGKETRRC